MDNNSIKYKNLKISPLTKNRLDKLKGRNTYDKYLDAVLGYFENTGIDPRYSQLPPQQSIIKALKEESAVLFKRIEDSIKIMRNIEMQKLDPVMHGIETILSGPISSSGVEDIGPDAEEVYQLVQINERLESKIKEQDNLISDLRRQLRLSQQTANVQEVISTVEELLSDRILPTDKNGDYILSKEHRLQLIRKIKTYSNV